MTLLIGTVLAWAAMITYFLVAVHSPGLRDSGLPNIALAWVGVMLAVVGAAQILRRGRRRWLPAIAVAVAVLPAAFLSHYVLILSYSLPAAAESPAVGQAAPALELPDADGRTVTLADLLRGEDGAERWLILDFFRGHW